MPDTALEPQPFFFATTLLVGLNLVVFAVMVASGISLVSPESEAMLRWGADYGPLTLGGEYWRTVTQSFLHFGIVHLLLNMYCLWSLARLSERMFGAGNTIALYVLTGVGASLLSLSWDPFRVSAGASGAIFGIAGAIIVFLHRGDHGLPQERKGTLLRQTLQFAGYNLIFGLLSPRVDNMAHLGGLLAGVAIGYFLMRIVNSEPDERRARSMLVLGVATIVLASQLFVVAHSKRYAVISEQGHEAMQKKDYKAAMPKWQEYVKLRPDDASGHAVLAYCLDVLEQYPEAIREYERALTLDPNDADVEANLARLYGMQDQLSKAAQLYEHAISKLEPQADVFLGAADVYFRMKDHKRAEDFTRRARLMRNQQKHVVNSQTFSPLQESRKRLPRNSNAQSS
jgi:membrane associated rhomboid family serine protease/Flp pilus assembly protein TadD